MIISADGIVIRTPLQDVAIQGRSTQGVRVMRLGDNDKVVAIACFD